MSQHNKIQTYLTSIQTDKLSPSAKQKIQRLNNTVLNDIGNEIVQSRLIIPDHEKQLNLKSTGNYADQKNGVNNIDKKYKEIEGKKKAILEELENLQMMESRLKMDRSKTHLSNITLVNMGKNAKIRSQFTEYQLSKIKQIYKKQKKFHKQIQSKIKKYQLDQQQYKQQLQKQQKIKIQQLCMQKHEQRQKYIKEIHDRNKKRQKILAEQRQKIMELKKKKKLFQEMEEEFLKSKEMEREQMKEKLMEYKKKRDFSFDAMKEHVSKYDEEKRAKDEKREQKLRNFKNVNETKFPCLFLDRIKDEDERVCFQKQEKNEMVRTYVQKKTAFAEQVRKRLHKNMKTMSQSKLNNVSRLQAKQQPKWLNTPQKYHKGTQYMRQINSKIIKLPRKVPQTKQQKLKNSQRFKNYLNDIRNSQILKKESKQNNISHAYTNMNLTAAKQNITSVNLAKSVKAKIQIMNKLQNIM